MKLKSFALFMSACLWSGYAYALIPAYQEARYCKAVIAFQEGNYDRTIFLADQIILRVPNATEALELKAQALSLSDRYDEALLAYEEAIEVWRVSHPDSDLATPYQYELGYVYYSQQKYAEAKTHFETALSQGVNPAESHYYLGTIGAETLHWTSAREHFEEVLQSGDEALKAKAKVGITRLSLASNDTAGFINRYVATEEWVRDQAERPDLSERSQLLAKDLSANMQKELRAFNRTKFMGEASLATGYDSNILSQVIPEGSAVISTKYDVSYSSPPLNPWQYIAGYRGSFNFNSNSDARSAEYLEQGLSLFVTHSPLTPSHYGFKLDLSGVLQYVGDSETGLIGNLSPFRLGGVIGPYGKYEFYPNWVVGGDAFFQLFKYFQDINIAEFQQSSGWGQLFRIYVAREEPLTYWNPIVAASGFINQTAGTEFRSRTVKLEIGNNFYISRQQLAAVAVGAAATFFDYRPEGTRQDGILFGKASYGRWFTNDILAVADIEFIKNASSSNDYTYNRFVSSIGATYHF